MKEGLDEGQLRSELSRIFRIRPEEEEAAEEARRAESESARNLVS